MTDKRPPKPPIFVERRGSHFIPIDAWAEQQIQSFPEGQALAARVTKARATAQDEALGWLGKWWAGINLLHENTDDPERRWPTPRHLHNEILKELGYFTRIIRADGYKDEPESVAVDKMEMEDRVYLQEQARTYCLGRWDFDPWAAWERQKDAEKAANTRGFQ